MTTLANPRNLAILTVRTAHPDALIVPVPHPHRTGRAIGYKVMTSSGAAGVKLAFGWSVAEAWLGARATVLGVTVYECSCGWEWEAPVGEGGAGTCGACPRCGGEEFGKVA